MNSFKKQFFVVFLTLLAVVADGQEKLTEHTYKLNEAATPGTGSLADVSWLVGSWYGSAFGSQFEEVWNPASVDSMLGMFKLFDADKGVIFYELMLLKQVDNSLELWVKHFSSDFVAWEEKADFIKFKLVSVESQAVHFSGLSFYQNGTDKIDGYIVMQHKDGSKTEQPINYHRVKTELD